MLFSLHKHHLDLFVADTALKVSKCLYCFIISIAHGVENYFPQLWGTGISDAIFVTWIVRLMEEKQRVETELQQEMERKLEEQDKNLESRLVAEKEKLERVITKKETEQLLLQQELEVRT